MADNIEFVVELNVDLATVVEGYFDLVVALLVALFCLRCLAFTRRLEGGRAGVVDGVGRDGQVGAFGPILLGY